MDTAITVNGNITRDLELRETTDGTPVLTIPLACSRRRKVGDEWTEELPGYHDVVVFRKTAEHAAATFAKGDRVLAHGRLNRGDYTDRDGIKRRANEVQADVVAADLTFTAVQIPRAK